MPPLSTSATESQVGTAFALCVESGLSSELRRRVIAASRTGAAVITDPCASPSGYPFKVLQLEGSLSDPAVYAQRRRHCDIGQLRTPYVGVDGRVGYRCASEPSTTYLRKGGVRADTVRRMCLCNALLAAAGLAQQRNSGPEPPVVTIGEDVVRLVAVLGQSGEWTAADVVSYLLDGVATR